MVVMMIKVVQAVDRSTPCINIFLANTYNNMQKDYKMLENHVSLSQ